MSGDKYSVTRQQNVSPDILREWYLCQDGEHH